MGKAVDGLSESEIEALPELLAERRHAVARIDASDDLILLVIVVVVIIVALGLIAHYLFWGR